jgi:uroporphyrinogen III methyltransferase/synthase
LGDLLRTCGAEPVLIPMIAIRRLDTAPLDAALEQAWDWIVATSPNGARVVLDRLAERGLPTRWAAIGPRTAETLMASGIEPRIALSDGTGAALAEALGRVEGQQVLLARARTATKDLPRILRAQGAHVRDVAVYETIAGPESSRAPLAQALADGIDAVIFTSGSTVEGFTRLAAEPALALASKTVVAIGPTTAGAVRETGVEPRVARARTPLAIVQALASLEERGVDG